LRGGIYAGVASGSAQKKMALEKFREHNIVKAMVTKRALWVDDDPETILIGNALRLTDDLRTQHQAGKLQAIVELAPLYRAQWQMFLPSCLFCSGSGVENSDRGAYLSWQSKLRFPPHARNACRYAHIQR
jgi:hypothetical protein